MTMPPIPEYLIYPLDVFAKDFERLLQLGTQTLLDADVCVVGLARNCDALLFHNLRRLSTLTKECRSWRLHVETNDNADNTEQVLLDYCAAHPQATFTSQRLGRQQFSAEFAGPRTQALAEYRTACQRWVRENAGDSDFVVVIDFDMGAGWSHAGFLAGLGSLQDEPNAYGMASVSLFQHQWDAATPPQWLHYDCWALRHTTAWDDYSNGFGGWKYQWLPPIGSPAIPVVSAFGGMAVYDTDAYLHGVYDGSDCEHVGFHVSAARKTGRQLYLCPSMRTVMRWVEAENGGHNGNH